MAGPKILSLFSGVGGLEVAIGLAFPGSEVVGYVERDSYAAAALMARMEESSMDLAPIFCGEIQDVDGRELRGHVDVVCGGIPCQPYSLAGRHLGDEDDRALWHEFARIVGECQPSLVFVENVPTFVTGAGFRPLGEELCRLGYEIADPLFISAGDVGAPHVRRRVFILAYRNLDGSEEQRSGSEPDPGERSTQRDDADGRDEGLADAASDGRAQGPPERRGGAEVEGSGEGRFGTGDRGEAVADAERERLQGEQQGGSEAGATERADRSEGTVGRGKIPDAERDEVRVESERGRGPAREAERGHPIAGNLGIFPPGPSDFEEWRRVLETHPHLTPAAECSFRRVVDGSANRMDGDLDGPSKYNSKASARHDFDRWFRLHRLWLDRFFGEAPSGLRRAAEGGDPLPSMPHSAPSGEADAAVCDLRGDDPTEGTPDETKALRGPEVQSRTRKGLRFEEVENDMSRADQLRCCGNAVVPLQAAMAFRQLLQWIGGTDG